MIRVCSGFSPAGYTEYGQRFLDTFDQHWPRDIDLTVYTEQPVAVPRGECRDLWQCQGVKEFVDRHSANPLYNGKVPTAVWRDKHRTRGYHFKTDAVKFCRQCFIPRDAAIDMADGDILVWLDADVVSFADLPRKFVEDLLGDADLVFLGRRGTHSEIGFWAVRLNERSRAFLDHFAHVWVCGVVFTLAEWHSAFMFDWCRANQFGLRQKNLTPNGTGHVWFQSPLRKYTDHCKGERKALGYSPERKT